MVFTSTSNMDIPRDIPSGLKRRIIFSNPFMLVALIQFIVGGILISVFSFLVDFSDMKFKGGEPRVTGTLTQMVKTNTRVNHANIYEYDFTYTTPDNVKRTGMSYDYYDEFPNDAVEVEYVAAQPEISRIIGMDRSQMSPWALLGGAIPLLMGFIFFFIAYKKGKKNLYLVCNGILTEGKIISSERTNTRINNRYVYRVTFQFNANGTPIQAVTRTHLMDRITDEAKEKVIYDANDPQNANFVDAMPKSVKRYFEGGY